MKSFKKILACLLALSLLLCSLPAALADSYLLGDADRDGSVTVSDVVALRQAIVQGEAAPALLETGDLDEDGKLTVSDVVALRGLILSGGEGTCIDTPFGDLEAAYRITAKFSGKAVCPSDINTGLGQWEDVGARSQLWKIVPAGGGYYLLESPATGKVLTLGEAGDILMFQMDEYAGLDTQKIKFLPAGEDGYWNLTVKSTGENRYMEIPFAGLTETAGRTDGWPFWMGDGNDTDNKRFTVVAAEVDTPVFDAAWAESVYDTFMKQFKGDDGNGGAYFIGSSDFWKTAELTEMILDCYEATGEQKYLNDYEDFYRGFINAHGTNWSSNKYNDDLIWMVISCCRAYQLTQKDEYRNVAKENFDLVYKRGYDDVLGGGVYWTTDKGEKNACINGPMTIAACYLSQMFDGAAGAAYMEYAKSIYAWERATLFNAETGEVYDNIAVDGTLSTTVFTYNLGTFIGSGALLYRLTGDAAYRSDAKLAADHTMQVKYQSNCITDESGGDLDGFKGILVRWLYKYIDMTGTTDYDAWLALNITTGWENRNNLGLVGTKWGCRSSGDEPEAPFSYGTYISLIMPFDLSSIPQ